MLKKSNKNSGMSLIEVIVSMLVLSIAVVAVTMSFSTASKINMGSKTKQAVESLMENLLEYAEAGGTDYQGWFEATDATPESTGGVATKTKTLYKGIKQGMYTYDVRVLVDTAPTAEYNTLNQKEVIQFGGTSGITIMIDASLKSYDVTRNDELAAPADVDVSDYDEEAYEFFYNMHTSAVLEHNIIDEQEELADPDGHEEDHWDLTELKDIPGFVDRELRLEVTKPADDKMQLTANLTYKLNSSIKVPSVADATYKRTLFVSELYDLASDTDEDARKLSQIYIMYSPAALETVGCGLGQDIRIMDPQHVLSANIFIANQQVSLEGVGDAIDKDETNQRDISTHTVFVSALNPDTGAANMYPAGGDIYCSGDVTLQGFLGTTTAHSDKLVAKGQDVRLAKTTLEILEAGTNNVLANESVTHLQ